MIKCWFLSGGRASAGADAATTFYWHDFKFTPRFHKGDLCGFEATCYVHKQDESNACRRTRNFAAHGGLDRTICKLKWWVLHASSCKTQGAHRRLKSPERVPNADQLEEQFASAEKKERHIDRLWPPMLCC